VIAASDVEDGHRWSPMSWINFARDYPNIVKLYLPKGVIHDGFPMSEMVVRRLLLPECLCRRRRLATATSLLLPFVGYC